MSKNKPHNFLILGMPRSRTTWLSVLFSIMGSVCYHDPMRYIAPDKLRVWMENQPHPIFGISDTGISIYSDIILKDFHDVPKLLIFRPLEASSIVVNRPGASNTIAADLTAKPPADGYTLLVATNTGQAIAPHLLKLSYDPLQQLQPVGLVVVVPNVLVVGDKVPANEVKELVATAKARPAQKYPSFNIRVSRWMAAYSAITSNGRKNPCISFSIAPRAY